jgi:hypothetical protein
MSYMRLSSDSERHAYRPEVASGLDLPPSTLDLGRMALNEIEIKTPATVDDVIDLYIDAGLLVELD